MDGAIHRAGGGAILEECRAIRARRGELPPGQAVATTGGNGGGKGGARSGPAPRAGAGYFAAPRAASLAALATTNLSRVRAGIFISSPVWGFRPMRAL